MYNLVVRYLRQREGRRIVVKYSQIWQVDSCISFANAVIHQKSQIWKRLAEPIIDKHDRDLAVRSRNTCIPACKSRFLADRRSLPLKPFEATLGHIFSREGRGCGTL
jgi:hypothetical protein